MIADSVALQTAPIMRIYTPYVDCKAGTMSLARPAALRSLRALAAPAFKNRGAAACRSSVRCKSSLEPSNVVELAKMARVDASQEDVRENKVGAWLADGCRAAHCKW